MVAGQEKDIHKFFMSIKKDNLKIFKQVLELLKYSLSTNDEEIIKSTIESVIEILEEVINKTR